MEATDWVNLREPWERLIWARRHWQTETGITPTVRAAAESLGIKEGTYASYERPPGSSKHTPLDHHRAIQFGRKFKVNWVWILSGEQTPFEQTPAEKRAAKLLAEADKEQQEMAVDMLEAAFRRRAG